MFFCVCISWCLFDCLSFFVIQSLSLFVSMPLSLPLCVSVWKISSFLAMNIKKCILPAQKRHNFQKLSQTQNGKLCFSPTFQKVELRNSTFFQLTQFHHFFSNHRSSHTIHPNTPVAPSSVILFAERLLKSGSDEGFEGHRVSPVASFHSRVSVLF